jgi:predicted dehydrogenase
VSKHCVGFIGAGMISQIAYLPFYLNNKKIYLKTISDDRPSVKKYLANNFNFYNIVENYKDILNDNDIKTVVIIAPREANASLAYEALSKGKNVIIEKPIGYSLNQILQQLKMTNKFKVKCHVGYMKRYDLGIQKTKSLFLNYLENNKMGKLITSRFYNYSNNYAYKIPKHQKKEESRTNRFSIMKPHPDWLQNQYHKAFDWFLNLGSHDINLINYFFDNKLVFHKAYMINDLHIRSNFLYKKSLVTFDLVNTELGIWEEGGEFIFEKGRITFKIPSPMNKNKITHVQIQLNSDLKVIKYNLKGDWSFKAQAKFLISAVTDGKDSLCMAEDCLKDMELIEQIWQDITS